MKKIIFTVAMTCLPALSLAAPGSFIQAQFGPSSTLVTAGIATGYLWGGNHFNYGAQLGVQGGPSLINVDALGITEYTFDSGVIIFAKAGFAYLNYTAYDLWTDEKINQLSGSGFGPKFAVGIGYKFNARWEMDFDAEASYMCDPFATAYYDKDNAPSVYGGGLFTGLTYHFA